MYLGPEYWRSLEELAGSEEFQEMLHREFPKGASERLEAISAPRLPARPMGASLALRRVDGLHAGLPTPPRSSLMCGNRKTWFPGRPMFYATAFTLGGYASPIPG